MSAGDTLRKHRASAGSARLRHVADEEGSVIPAQAGIHFDVDSGFDCGLSRFQAARKIKMDAGLRRGHESPLPRPVNTACSPDNDVGISIGDGVAIGIAEHAP